MSDGRCRACGAALAPNAAWCSLCFADLRLPAPEPVREPATVAAAAERPLAAAPVAAQPGAATESNGVTSPFAAGPPVGVEGPLDPPAPVEIDLSHPLGMARPAAPKPTWPCPRCEHQVSIDLDACDACGAGFLAGAAASESIRLPLVGEVTKMSSSQRLMMAIGVALAVTVVLVLLAFVGGHLFT